MTVQQKVRLYLLRNENVTVGDVERVFKVARGYAASLLQRARYKRVRVTKQGRRVESLKVYSAEENAAFLQEMASPDPEHDTVTPELTLKSDPSSEEKKPTTVTEDKKKFDNMYWQGQYKQLSRKYEDLVRESCVEDRLVQSARDVLQTPYNALPSIKCQEQPSALHTPQSAVLLLSDAHIGKVVDPGQTLNFGRYSFEVFCSRLKHLENRVISIVTEHQKAQIKKLVIAMLGDMIDGSLNHGAEAGQENDVFTQAYNGAHVVAQFLRNIAPHVPEIQVETVVGNHGRWGNQKKMPTKNRFSNLDMFFYAIVEGLVKDIGNIKFNLNTQPFQTLMVEESVLWLGHGDHLKGGDKALGVPAHSIGRQLSTVAQMHSREGRQVPNIYCVGDKHKSMELPHCNGDFIINSSFVGYDEYAHASNFPDSGPAQKLFFVHPKYGRTATYNIYLQHAADVDAPYDLPTGFEIQ